MWLFWGWLAVASADAPDGLRPVMAPWDAPTKWGAYLEQAGRPADPLACSVWIEDHVRLCLRVREGGRLRWVTAGDLAAWGLTQEAAVDALRAPSKVKLTAAETLPVEGMNGRYLRLVDGEGWAAAVALHPAAAARALGPDARFAFPAGTVAVAWPAGDKDLDKAMAVGVVELADEQPGEVSRMVFRWDGEALVPFAEAKPTEVPATP